MSLNPPPRESGGPPFFPKQEPFCRVATFPLTGESPQGEGFRGILIIALLIVLSLIGLFLGMKYSSQINDFLDKLSIKLKRNK